MIVASVASDSRRSGRFDLRRKERSSCTTAGSSPASGSSIRAEVSAANVLTVVTRVNSLPIRSSSSRSTSGTSAAHASPRWQMTRPMQRMAHSFTSCSWSCLVSCSRAQPKSAPTCGLKSKLAAGGSGRSTRTSSQHTRSASAVSL